MSETFVFSSSLNIEFKPPGITIQMPVDQMLQGEPESMDQNNGHNQGANIPESVVNRMSSSRI